MGDDWQVLSTSYTYSGVSYASHRVYISSGNEWINPSWLAGWEFFGCGVCPLWYWDEHVDRY
jgi:hypothetical protein